MILIGHSAGAHLSTLATLFLIEGREELFIEAGKQLEVITAIRGVIGNHAVSFIQTNEFHHVLCLQKM